MLKQIAHIGVAVKSLENSLKLFERLLGKKPDRLESVGGQKVDTAMFDVGGSAIELLQATSPDSPVAKFIGKRGEGIHHLSFVVDDIEKELVRLREEGFRLIDEKPRLGADSYLVAFLHPKSTNDILIEISQKRK